MPKNPSERSSIRSLQARAAAHRSWANTANPSARTAAGRATFLDRFEREFAHLPAAERERRAKHARMAYFSDLARKSAKARQRASR
jgi:hypothetical protein